MRALVLLAENLFFPIAALFFLLRFALSSRRRLLRDLPRELAERCGGGKPLAPGGPVLWVHAASAGEVEAARAMLDLIKNGPRPPRILVTCSTKAGQRRAASLSCVDEARLAPLDCHPFVRRFLLLHDPYSLLVVETELWPHMIELSARHGTRLALINGRLSPESFPRYRRFRALAAPFLEHFQALALQTESDRERFLALGAPPEKISVCGNMKYDNASPAAPSPALISALAALNWGHKPLLVAGSTHPGEEEIILEAYAALQERFADLRLALAPRHPERAARVQETLRQRRIPHSLFSQPTPPARCLLIDAMGILPELYSLAAISFVGGTLAPVGGHNLLEPALAGSPVLFGPHTFHTPEPAERLERSGGGRRISNAREFVGVAAQLLASPEFRRQTGEHARQTALGLRGASQRTLNRLRPLLDFS